MNKENEEKRILRKKQKLQDSVNRIVLLFTVLKINNNSKNTPETLCVRNST